MIKLILSMVFFVMVANFINFADSREIIEAAKWGDIDKVRNFLEKNPGLIKVTDKGLCATALHWAAIYGRKQVLKIILNYNPDVNTQEEHGGTTMHWAAHFDDPEVIGWLLDRGASIDHVNRYGRTPLLVAARRGCKKVIQILIKRGANIRATLRDGSTALHIAAKNGHADVIDYLIGQGLDPGIINKQNLTYKDVLFKRPKTAKIDPKVYSGYAGLYKRIDGRILDIRLEKHHLYYYAYGKDELLPITDSQFITSAELKIFTFIKADTGEIIGLQFKIGNRVIEAKKI
jgi:ankyrin repeat protein